LACITLRKVESVVTGHYVVGVDGGASKTVALIGTVEGKILGRGETGSSNYHNVGSTVASNAIKKAVLEAKRNASLGLGFRFRSACTDFVCLGTIL